MAKIDPSLAHIFSSISNLNLAFITKFHDEVKRLLHNEICYMNQRIDEDRNLESDQAFNFQVRKELYLNTMEPSLRTVTFLMMFSHLEEWLFHLKSTFAKSIELDDQNRGSLGRFKPILKEGLGVDLGQCSEWSRLMKIEKVRNCLLHANGRVDLVTRDRKQLERIIDQSAGLSVEKNRLLVSGEYLQEFQRNVSRLVAFVEPNDC